MGRISRDYTKVGEARLDAWTPASFGTTDYSDTTWAVMPNHSRFMDHRALEKALS